MQKEAIQQLEHTDVTTTHFNTVSYLATTVSHLRTHSCNHISIDTPISVSSKEVLHIFCWLKIKPKVQNILSLVCSCILHWITNLPQIRCFHTFQSVGTFSITQFLFIMNFLHLIVLKLHLVFICKIQRFQLH